MWSSLRGLVPGMRASAAIVAASATYASPATPPGKLAAQQGRTATKRFVTSGSRKITACETVSAKKLRGTYPEIQPFETGMLRTNDGKHQIYYEVSGNPAGKPAIFMHGGPGDGSSPKHRRLFDPSVYKIVVFDQRGAGQSLPTGSIEANTTADLIKDVEQLRQQLAVERWDLLVGGSWGSTLALAYAQEHPSRVKAMVVYSIFIPSQRSIDWLYCSGGASEFFPDAYHRFISSLPCSERSTPMESLYRRVTSPDDSIRFPARASLSTWTMTCLALTPDNDLITQITSKPENLGDGCIIELHYMRHGTFMEEGQILRDCTKIGHIPCIILHGRYDMICVPAGAWQLHQMLPLSKLHIIPESGHSSSAAPRLKSAIVEAIDSFR